MLIDVRITLHSSGKARFHINNMEIPVFRWILAKSLISYHSKICVAFFFCMMCTELRDVHNKWLTGDYLSRLKSLGWGWGWGLLVVVVVMGVGGGGWGGGGGINCSTHNKRALRHIVGTCPHSYLLCRETRGDRYCHRWPVIQGIDDVPVASLITHQTSNAAGCTLKQTWRHSHALFHNILMPCIYLLRTDFF